MLNTRLREILEGRLFWPRLLASPLIWRQTGRRDRLKRRYDEIQRERDEIDRHRNVWERELKAARDQQKPTKECKYPKHHKVAKHLRRLRKRRLLGWTIRKRQLTFAVKGLTRVLKRAAIDAPKKGDVKDAHRLDADQDSVIRLADYAIARYSDRAYRLSGELQFSFPGDALAPTAMGNVAQSIPSYTYSRYRMNIDLFWTRLQKVMEGDPFYAVLQDAKTQLDFLVALVWLTALTMIGWLPYMVMRSYDVRPFLIVAIAGPIALTSCYNLAVQNYRAFADLVRASVDLYRLELLKELKLAQPESVAAEAQLWAALNRRMNYGSTRSTSLTTRRSDEDPNGSAGRVHRACDARGGPD